jgi:photosystem II stability/assembly factor-like uncharacterized protein
MEFISGAVVSLHGLLAFALVAGCGGTQGIVLDPLDLSMAMTTAANDLAGVDLVGATPDLANADLAGNPDIAQIAQWQTMSSGTSVDLYGGWGPLSEQLYVVGGRPGVTTGNPGVILHGDGIGWTVGTNLVNLFSVSGSSKYTGTAVGEYGGEGSLTSRGGGAWSSRSVLAPGTLTSIWATRFAEQYVVTSNGAVFQSLNGGTWTALDTGGNTAALNGVWGSSAMDIYAVGANGKILHTTNGGTNWTTPTSPVSSTLYAVWGSSANDVYAVGASALLHSTDGGTVWNQGQLPSGTSTFYGVWGTGANDVYAVGADGVIIHSTGNDVWTKEVSGTTNELRGIFGVSNGDLYAVGRMGTILQKKAGGGATVACGGNACATPTTSCCVTTPASMSCGATCSSPIATARCDGPEDCGGNVCCGSTGDTVFSSSCEPSCSQRTFCHTNQDCPSGEPYCCPDPQFPVRQCSATPGSNCG